MFDKWLNLDEVDAQTLLSALSEGCRRYLAGYPCGGFSDEAQTLLDLTEQYPGDTGVLAALLLNRMTLNPGEGIYLDAGHLHAYVRGTGVEIMANSDNVLRGGMTTKNVNRDELMRVLRFDPISPPIVRAEPLADSSWNAVILHYPTPAQEFRLRRVEIDGSSAVGSAGCAIMHAALRFSSARRERAGSLSREWKPSTPDVSSWWNRVNRFGCRPARR